jgi:predicted dehydrogenase
LFDWPAHEHNTSSIAHFFLIRGLTMSANLRRTTRREFLAATTRLAAGVGLTAGLPTIFAGNSARAADSDSPAEQIRIGCIGVGNQGRGNMGQHLKNVVAVCEVDQIRLGTAKEAVEKASKKTCAAYGDYRQLLADQNVDAVIVTTPDHWHAMITIDACAAGKDVYCEKPLTLAVAEGQAMVRAARNHGRIVQTGSQQRSDDRFRLACELVRNGRLGKIRTIKVGIPKVNFSGPAVADSQPPATLDYDFWLGPAPLKPYNEKHVHYLFRFFWDYSGGQLTNFGAHHLDIVQWALGTDDTGPVAIEGQARYHPQGWFEVPEWFDIKYQYANGPTVLCGQDYKGGVTFEGERGTLFVDRAKIESNPTEIAKTALVETDVRLSISKNHHKNWLECVRSRQRPICDVETGHRAATICHLGNIAVRTGRPIAWDPAREEIVGDSEAAKMLSRPYRSPWKLPQV